MMVIRGNILLYLLDQGLNGCPSPSRRVGESRIKVPVVPGADGVEHVV